MTLEEILAFVRLLGKELPASVQINSDGTYVLRVDKIYEKILRTKEEFLSEWDHYK